ncbi:MAG TPA: peptidylprolyl isomerase [Longimicrobium sp.]|jgi:peptidylprolyl isomerase|uniref:FKBP-type peptidyl-prolyl cis-trans isomerase n=1 Tax=Longimicrobium sp. TaxID=2029185 RepID=UPI002ED9DF62
MAEARMGDTVRVHYTGTLDDGSVFDSSEGRDPLEFTLGQGHVIAGFERGVAGMQAGDERTVTIPAQDAYGEHREEMVLRVPRSQFPQGMVPQVGQQLQMSDGQNTFIVTVVEVGDDSVLLDANHALAGKQLTFKLKLVDIG